MALKIWLLSLLSSLQRKSKMILLKGKLIILRIKQSVISFKFRISDQKFLILWLSFSFTSVLFLLFTYQEEQDFYFSLNIIFTSLASWATILSVWDSKVRPISKFQMIHNRGNFIKDIKPIKDINHLDINIHRFHEVYKKRKIDKAFTDLLDSNTPAILITGKSMIGKNRLIYNNLKDHSRLCNTGYFLPIDNLYKYLDRIDDFLSFLNQLKLNFPLILLIEDLDELHNILYPRYLRELLRIVISKNEKTYESSNLLTIIAWCRSGHEYKEILKTYQDILMDFKHIEVDDLPVKDAEELCEVIYSEKDPKDYLGVLKFNGTPGSIVMGPVLRTERINLLFKHNISLKALYNVLGLIFSCLKAPWIEELYICELLTSIHDFKKSEYEKAIKTLIEEGIIRRTVTEHSKHLKTTHITELDLLVEEQRICPWEEYNELIQYISKRILDPTKIKRSDINILFAIAQNAWEKAQEKKELDKTWITRCKSVLKLIISSSDSLDDEILQIQNKAREVALFALGYSLREEGSHQEAKRAYRKAGTPEALYNIAKILEGEGHYEEAKKTYRKAATPKAWHNLGCILVEEGHREEAKAMFRKANTPESLYNLAYLLEKEEYLKEAKETYKKAGTPKAWNNLGYILEREKYYQEAKDSYRKAETPMAWINLASLLEKEGNFQEAEEAYRKAGTPKAWHFLSQLLHEQGKISESELILEKLKSCIKVKVKSVKIPLRTIKEMTKRAIEKRPLGVGGLILGKVIDDGEIHITGFKYLRSGREETIQIDDDDLSSEEIENQLEESSVIGWWHSHPGFGIFLTDLDLQTHARYFQSHSPFSIALVIEPTHINPNQTAKFSVFQIEGSLELNQYESEEIEVIVHYSAEET